MRRLTFLPLLALLAVGACKSGKPAGQTAQLSKVVTQFQTGWVFGQEYDIEEAAQGTRPAANAERGAYRVSGKLTPKSGAISLQSVGNSVDQFARSKLTELGVRVRDVKRSPLGMNGRATTISYQDDSVAGVMMVSLTTSGDGSSVGYAIDIQEAPRPRAEPSGSG